MPVYEYRCGECGARFEVLVRGQEEITCPRCGSESLDKLLSAAHISTGRADRQPSRTCCGRTERCDAPPCSQEAGGCWRG